MLDMNWNPDGQYFEAEIGGKTLTVWPELTGYADGRAAVRFNYDHVDYAWSYVDGVTRTTVAGVTRRRYEDYPAVPRYIIPGLDYHERDMLSDVLVAGVNKGRSKYMCLLGGSLCRRAYE